MRINALNPDWFVKYNREIIELLNYDKIKSLVIPIQSGNSRILKLMNRYSNRTKLLDCFQKIKQETPEITLSTQVIVGFPSETREEFQDSLDFIKEANIDMGQFYRMSLRPNTKAIEFDPKISEEETSKRIITANRFLRRNNYTSICFCGSVGFGRKATAQ